MDMEYSLPGLDALAKGARFDARAAFAMELMKSLSFAGMIGDSRLTPDELTNYALDLAESLFAQAKARELLKPLSLEPNISPTERAHIVRNANAQVLGQVAGAEAARQAQREMSPVLVPNIARPN